MVLCSSRRAVCTAASSQIRTAARAARALRPCLAILPLWPSSPGKRGRLAQKCGIVRGSGYPALCHAPNQRAWARVSVRGFRVARVSAREKGGERAPLVAVETFSQGRPASTQICRRAGIATPRRLIEHPQVHCPQVSHAPNADGIDVERRTAVPALAVTSRVHARCRLVDKRSLHSLLLGLVYYRLKTAPEVRLTAST